jgi:glucokinase
MVGIDVGGTSIKAGLVGRRGDLLVEAPRRPTREHPDEVVDVDLLVERIVEMAQALLVAGRGTIEDDAVKGVGVVVPGIIDEDRGVVLSALQVRFAGEPLTERLGDRLHLPVWLDHDVRAAAIAEGLWGAAIGSLDYLLVAIGTGVGAAVVLDGKPYRRSGGVGSEFGHMSVNIGPDAPICLCERPGCVEEYASGGGIERRYLEMAHPPSVLKAPEVLALVGTDEHADRIFDDAVRAMAVGIMNAIVLFAPELVLIGGGVADNDMLIEGVRHELREQQPNFLARIHRDVPPIERPKFRRKAGTMGAAASAWLRSGVTRRVLMGSSPDAQDPPTPRTAV